MNVVYMVVSGAACKQIWRVCESKEVAQGQIEKYKPVYGDIFSIEAWSVAEYIND